MNTNPERIELSLLHGANIANVVCPICEVVVNRGAFGEVHRWKCAGCGHTVVDKTSPTGQCPRCGKIDFDLLELDVSLKGRVALPRPCDCCQVAPMLLHKVFHREEGVLGVVRFVDNDDNTFCFAPFVPERRTLESPEADGTLTVFLQHNMVIRGTPREDNIPKIEMVLNPGMRDVFVHVRKGPDGGIILSKARGIYDGSDYTETV